MFGCVVLLPSYPLTASLFCPVPLFFIACFRVFVVNFFGGRFQRRLRFGFQVFCGSFAELTFVLATFVARFVVRIRNTVVFIKLNYRGLLSFSNFSFSFT